MLNTETIAVNGTSVHRRKPSSDEDDNTIVFPSVSPPKPQVIEPPAKVNGDVSSPAISPTSTSSGHDVGQDIPMVNGHSSGDHPDPSPVVERSRVFSTPSQSFHQSIFPTSHSHPPQPPSAGPYRTTFSLSHPQPPPSSVLNGTSTAHILPPNGRHHHQAPHMRQSLSLPSHSSHGRTRSVSGPFSPSSPSPLSVSFPPSTSSPASLPPKPNTPSSFRFPSTPGPDLHDPFQAARAAGGLNGLPPSSSAQTTNHNRRHSRLHSRNLSIFFPRPGSLPSTSIAEDGAQEVDFASESSFSGSAGGEGTGSLVSEVSSPAAGQRTFKEGFTFGSRPPAMSLPSGSLSPSASSSSSFNGHPMPGLGHAHGHGSNSSSSGMGASKRGHHHKHSLSHNFFSFLEPGEDLHTTPAPMPVSPWNPISPFPGTPPPDKDKDKDHKHDHEHGHGHSHGHDHDDACDHSHSHTHSHSHEGHSHDHEREHDHHGHSHSHTDHDSHSHSHSHSHSQPRSHSLHKPSNIGIIRANPQISPISVIMTCWQFILGAALWVSGQQIGSLGCTGLGYWVVFDAFGVALGRVLPSYLARPGVRDEKRRMYG
ncbi:hypothetical protein NLI96_g10625 [Meripilus lineatus]|uniref:Uncharacterized protein n=1 Tax=Meripilus lineatus TaxID=2056292 RepID=A0AAD5UTB7_9APHY|nr:hypothetical protein NLI96_g10625 [Physisporinus lineatus]